jgi:hypothetical protein
MALPEPRLDPEDDFPALDDPVITALIERAVAPYRGVLPADALAELDELLWMVMATHPEVSPMVERLRRDAAVQRSGPRPVEGAARGTGKKGEQR